ncbi:MAG: hypothetical protein J6Y53_06090 [Alphaproteobacteria bacterium]|nr:hypothetical protein [Alphaproteobacteria bacterium]
MGDRTLLFTLYIMDMENFVKSGDKSEEIVSSSGAVEVDDFIKLFKTDANNKLSYHEKQTAKIIAKELRRLGMLTDGKKGFNQEAYDTVIKKLKAM